MATIAFCVAPMAGPVNGALHLAKSLRGRGHRVVFYGMLDVEDFVEPDGFPFVPVHGAWFPKGCLNAWRSSAAGPVRTFLARRRSVMDYRAYFDFLLAGGEAEFLAALDTMKPDLLVVDGSIRPTWALLAHRGGVPSAYLHTTMPPADDGHRPPAFSTIVPDDSPETERRIRKAWRRHHRQRAAIIRTQSLLGFGFDWIAYARKLAQRWHYPLDKLNTRTMFSVLLDWPELILFPRAFEFPGPDDGRRIYVDGAIDLGRAEPPMSWDRVDPAKPLVYASFGSLHGRPGFVRLMMALASARPGWQLVVNVGPGRRAETYGDVPPNCLLLDGAPQLQLLPRAAAMVTHGGINSVRECIHFHVPMVVFPLTFDQPGTAARVCYHRLGVAGDLGKATPAGVAALVERVLGDAAVRANLDRMAAAFAAAETQQLAVHAIERMAGAMTGRTS